MKNKNNRYKITKEKIETGKVTSKSRYVVSKGSHWISRESGKFKGNVAFRIQKHVENSQVPKSKNPKPPKNNNYGKTE